MSRVNKPIDPKILQLIEAGAPVSSAVQITLAGSRDREAVRTAIPRFVERHKTLIRSAATSAIYGGRAPTDDLLEALAEELGGTTEQWKELLRYGDRIGLAAVAQ